MGELPRRGKMNKARDKRGIYTYPLTQFVQTGLNHPGGLHQDERL